MNFKPVLLGLTAAACVTAAAGSAFVAVRQNQAERITIDRSATPTDSDPGATPVKETEEVLPAEAPSAESPAAPKTSRREPMRPAPTRTNRAPAPVSARQGTAATTPARSADPGVPSSAPSPAASRDAAPVTPAQSSDWPSADSTATPEPAARVETKFVEVVLPASSVIGLQIERPVSSETARLEDRVEARVTRDVTAGGRRAIPAGSRMLGTVVLVERGGKVKEQARLGVRFHTLVLANGMEMPIRTESIFREGDPPSAESARKIAGAAAGGAILGAILGGGKGAVLGGATGAAGGTAAVMAGGRNAATLPSGAIVTARVAEPVTIQVEKE